MCSNTELINCRRTLLRSSWVSVLRSSTIFWSRAASDSDPFCTGFSLSQEGETLFLVSRAYVELDEVAVPYLETDTSYARRPDGKYVVTRVVTPGLANSFSD